MGQRSIVDIVLIVVGAIAVGIGAYRKWLTVNPARRGSPIPAVHYPGMDAGITGFGILAIAGAFLACLVRLFRSRDRFRALATLSIGGSIVALCVYYLDTEPLIGFREVFVPATGWYLTLIGGGIIAITGAVEAYRSMRGPDPSTSMVD